MREIVCYYKSSLPELYTAKTVVMDAFKGTQVYFHGIGGLGAFFTKHAYNLKGNLLVMMGVRLSESDVKELLKRVNEINLFGEQRELRDMFNYSIPTAKVDLFLDVRMSKLVIRNYIPIRKYEGDINE